MRKTLNFEEVAVKTEPGTPSKPDNEDPVPQQIKDNGAIVLDAEEDPVPEQIKDNGAILLDAEVYYKS